MANLKFRTADSMRTRELPDNTNTMTYLYKLSNASIVTVHFDNGTWQEIECGKVINKGKTQSAMNPVEQMKYSLEYQITELGTEGYFGQDFMKTAYEKLEPFEAEIIFNQFLFSTPCFIRATPPVKLPMARPYRNKSLTGWM